MREGRISTRQARAEASKIIGLGKQPRELRALNTFVRQIIGDLDKLFEDDKYKQKLRSLVRDAADIDWGLRDALIGSLEGVADRALGFARQFRAVEMKTAKQPTTKLLPNG